ncbi:MAG: HprK-related kinase B [Pseudomonadota bacterium]
MNVADVLAGFDLGALDGAAPFTVASGPFAVELRAREPLRSDLIAYFGTAVTDSAATDVVHVLDGQTLPDGIALRDWAREPGKTGRKDAILDLADGRLIGKVRTGVGFLEAPGWHLAFGPVRDHTNQVINFVNTQLLNQAQRAGWTMGHAAAVSDGRRTLAISGLSGGGKSTSMLRMMDLPGTRFVTNDRLLFRPVAGGTEALGIPKQPRINPGTILGNRRLHKMLPPARLDALRAMADGALWHLEEKHDLMVAEVYGPDRVAYAAPLTHYWVLNWSRDASAPAEVAEVNLTARTDLLDGIMKPRGPFYFSEDGTFDTEESSPDPAAYLTALQNVAVFEVTGAVDFDALAAEGAALFGAPG